MSFQQLKRLERLEAFVERLKLNSQVAKAADADGQGARVLGVTSTGDLKRLESRVEHLEEIAHLVTQPGGAADGELLLVKAVAAYDTPQSLMALGERTLKDPTQMGEFSGYLSTGNLHAARQMLDRATDRASFAKSVDAAQSLLEEPLGDFNNRRAASELTARFGSMERLLASIEARLAALERRPQAAPVQPGERVMVKAPGSKPMTRSQRADDLLRRIDRYIDSPTLTGQLSSLVTQGKLDEVEAVLERAQAAHKTAQIRNERRSWGQ